MSTSTTQYPSGTFLTGYFERKYLPEEIKKQTTTTSYHNWIYFRLAEMYLDYAEAINEVYGPDNDGGLGMTARKAVNTVRERSGVVDLPVDLSGDKASMRVRIQRERAIELCFEEQRWWDARRWSGGAQGELATSWFGGPFYKVTITKSGSTVAYSEDTYFTRIYKPINNLYEIPISEMYKNPLFVQNPGY
jgi:hypothetical protein